MAVRVAIAVVEQAGRVLVGVRGPQGPLPGLHEFPGGKLRPAEAPFAGACRECLEETGLEVEPLELLATISHAYAHGDVELSFVLCRPVRAAAAAPSGYEWVDAPRLSDLRFPAANAPVLSQLAARFGDAGR